MSAKRLEGNAGIITFPNLRTNVGIGTEVPAGKLDIASTNNGVLIPRVSLNSLNTIEPITTPTASELVYNTNTSGNGAAAVTPGYYYINPALNGWVRLATGTEATPDWKLAGNAGTNPNTNFLGTTDGQDFTIKTDNIERMRITSTGNVGIGTTNPTAKLEVNGDTFIADKLFQQTTTGRSAPSLFVDNIKPYTDTGVRIYDGNSNSHLSIESLGSTEIQAYTTTGAAGNALDISGTESNLILNPRGGNVGIGGVNPSEKLEVNAGNIFLNSSAGQFIKWTDVGSAAPSFTTRSAGTKLVLTPAVAVGRTDFAIGIDENTIWQAVPQNTPLYSHKFYGGITPLMTIKGDGNVGIGTTAPTASLDLNGSLKVKIVTVSTPNSRYDVTATDNYIHVDAANVLVALPDPTVNAGRVIYVSRSEQNGTGSTASGVIYSDSSGFTSNLALGLGLKTLVCSGSGWYTN